MILFFVPRVCAKVDLSNGFKECVCVCVGGGCVKFSIFSKQSKIIYLFN